MSEASILLVEKSEGIARITLNRPAALNALTAELRAALAAALDEAAADPRTGVVILTGAGRAFCAGLDLKELGGETGGQPDIAAAVGGDASLMQTMARCEKPIIGAINGLAITGGFEIALACDVIVASSAARFADTHVRIGILPGWGLSQRLSRAVGIYRAKEISLSGRFLEAEQAAAWGMVNRVVPPAELLPACRALAAEMLAGDAATLRGYKRVIDHGFAATLADGLAIEAAANRAHSLALTPQAIAARRASVQKRMRELGKPAGG